jgi:hypothetical protein
MQQRRKVEVYRIWAKFDINFLNVTFWWNFVVKTATDAYSAMWNFDTSSVLAEDK